MKFVILACLTYHLLLSGKQHIEANHLTCSEIGFPWKIYCCWTQSLSDL